MKHSEYSTYNIRPEFPVNTSTQMCLCLKINSLGKSQYVTGKKERKNRETQAVNIVQLSKWLRRFKLICHTLMAHISPCFAWRWQPNIQKSNNLQYNTVRRWVDGTIILPSDGPMFILITWELR
jgi:hypothetical protein